MLTPVPNNLIQIPAGVQEATGDPMYCEWVFCNELLIFWHAREETWILQRNVDLSQADMVVGYGQEDEFTVVRAQDPENPEYGFIDLKFSRDPVTLRQWVITNELGDRTAVVLDGMTTGISLSDNLFNTQIGRGGNRR